MTEPHTTLEGRVALVTGASRGLGAAIARGYADAGAAVVAVARSVDQLEQVVQHDPERISAARLDVRDPDSARSLLEEAQATTVDALQELRSLVRGIHPPVLSDRGLVGAIEALAVDMKLPVDVEARLDGHPPAPVESAAYFAVAECLANAGKHADATRVTVQVHHADDTLHLAVEDDGHGGARADGDGGLTGIARRLNAFDGQLTVTSPDGGPTRVAMMVPCELSSAKT